MGEIIGGILQFAVGVAVSPMPIIAVILMLTSRRAGVTSTAFLLGWLVSIVAVVTVTTVLARTAGLAPSGGGSKATAIVQLVLGALLLLLAFKQWRSRPAPGTEAPVPKWLAAIDTIGFGGAALLALVLGIPSKNGLMSVSAGVAIGQARLPIGQTIIVIAVFTVLAGLTVAAPIIIYRIAPTRSGQWLDSMKSWLTENNATIMTILFLVIGVVLVGKGIGGLS